MTEENMDSNKNAKRSASLSLEEILTDWLPDRLDAIQDMLWIMDLYVKFGYTASVQINIEGGHRHDWNLAKFGNPITDAGYLHARALLEFIGLSAKNGKLIQVGKRKPTDVAIEHYLIAGRRLAMVTPEDAYAAINMPQPVVEWALVNVIETTNKLLAHVTTGEVLAMAMYQQVRIALEGIPVLIQNHLYAKLALGDEAPLQQCGRYSCNSCERESAPPQDQ
jgi:hypothetical protein